MNLKLKLHIYSIALLIAGFISCKPAQQTDSTMSLINEIKSTLEGEFNNFQQCWQENTEEGIHQVTVKQPHKHIHTIFRPLSIEGAIGPLYEVVHTEGRNIDKILGREIFHFQAEEGSVYTDIYVSDANETELKSMSQLKEVVASLYWTKEQGKITAVSTFGNRKLVLEGDTLYMQGAGLFGETDLPYRMLKCRFFSGWVEYPLPEDPDSTYRMGNLRLHDQGGIVQLKLGDGTPTDYSVELTQLVYGKRISIMKLAVYQEPFEDIHYNSRAISYTWSNPEAKRLGINIRKIVSGWTLIEPGYVNSDNMNK